MLAAALFLLCPAARAMDAGSAAAVVAGKTLEGLMAEFMQENSLN